METPVTTEEYCCETFQEQAEYECDQHAHGPCPDQVLVRSKHHGFLLQAPNAHYSVNFCPWCGSKVTQWPYIEEAP